MHIHHNLFIFFHSLRRQLFFFLKKTLLPSTLNLLCRVANNMFRRGISGINTTMYDSNFVCIEYNKYTISDSVLFFVYLTF